MPARLPRGGRLLLLLGVLLVLFLLGGRLVSTFYVDVLWFESAGYLGVFWTRTLWQWGLRVVGGAVAAALVYANLRIVSETLGAIQIKRRVGDLEIAEKLPRSYVHWG
ncbi:MAG: hypothetical protein GWO00_00615, partial [Gemmatimonadetes bacterium]|nr:hypothetical protein [Gemmatimonadota bacterium]NIP77719.1 hypothetical protein [Gemmatimonadota bacterium]NIR76938.1 hypothetical protein [Gemmatimonadota bacterium]NIU29282.1 hypothetical protein [Gemmatimonadota bacterium]NIU34359.1 hypothetical protein [Gemmatimonadota bacterium]